MDSRLSRWCDTVIEASWLAAVILTPVFFNIHSDRVFEPDKLTLLRSLALLMTVVYLIKFVDQRGWQQLTRLRWRTPDSVWRMPFVLPLALLLLVYAISTLFSVSPAISWAGSYQRLQGTYTTLSYIAIFGVTVSTMRSRAQARRLITAVIITSIPIAFYGLLQHFDLDPLPWAGDTQQRVAGHMGNAIFIAAYLIMAVPPTLARIIVSFNNILRDDELSTADVIRSSIYIFTLAIQLITIYWSGSRGPWIGIGIGVFAFVLIVLVGLRNAASGDAPFGGRDAAKAVGLVVLGTAVAFTVSFLLLNLITRSGRLPGLAGPMASFVAFVLAVGLVGLVIFVMIAAQRGWRWLWLSWITLTVLLGLWLVTFNLVDDSTTANDTPVVGSVVETLASWRTLPRIGRLGTVLEADGGTGRVRVLIWEGVLDLITPHDPIQFPDGEQDTFNAIRPFIGYGPESMYVAYNRFYPPELATVEARNASPDRSHNETFDALVITGWLGLLVWQFLYLSVFYYSFRWLGVLRSTRERNLLIGLWVGMGVLLAAVFTAWRGAIYFGVALPFGSIIGLIIYLIYYALRGQGGDDGALDGQRPFATDRMLIVALVAAVLAHFVEIHFGIAIAATRTHFFLYIAILFVVGHLLPQLRPEVATAVVPAETAPEPAPRRPRRRGAPQPRQPRTVWFTKPMVLAVFVLALLVGTMGYEFMTYSQPPERTFSTAADLPVAEIVHQSLFVDAAKNYVDSPFIFVMIVMTWGLGTLLMISEMVKDGELSIAVSQTLTGNGRMIVTAVLAFVAAVALFSRFVLPLPVAAGATWLLGRSLLLGWGVLCGLTAAFVWLKTPSSQLMAGITAVVGLIGSLPVMAAGGWIGGLLVASISLWLFFTVRSREWSQTLTATAVMASVSFIIGMAYTYLHALVFRNSLFYRPATTIETLAQLQAFRVAEASQASVYIALFYLFAFGLIVTAALLAMPAATARQARGSSAGWGVLAVGLVLAPLLITVSNLRVVQADMIFKRGRFFDTQANGDAEFWESAIAIYQRTIEMAPREDYYYLFLGRAYLEASALAVDTTQQVALLDEAEAQLKKAQSINPLNTDHTANLARLNTRRVATTTDAAQQAARLREAERYYQDALLLSPQNSVIRNEYARLAYDLMADCPLAIELFDESVAIDPYFSETYFWLAETTLRCAGSDGLTAEAALAQATAVTEQALLQEANNPRAWLRAAQIYESMPDAAQAIAAYEKVRELDVAGRVLAVWRIDLLQAALYRDMGQVEQAQALAQQALAFAPPAAEGQVALFLSQFRPAPSYVGQTGRPLATVPAAQRDGYFTAYPDFVIDTSKQYEAIIVTEKGEMRFRLFTQAAPITVNSFVFLAEQGFYDGLTFHRVIADFVAQGGDPTAVGVGGPGYSFSDEISSAQLFDRPGLLAMANSGVDSNGSQFFITLGPIPSLNGRHTIFGEIIAGEDVLVQLTPRDPDQSPDFAGDLIERIEIVEQDS